MPGIDRKNGLRCLMWSAIGQAGSRYGVKLERGIPADLHKREPGRIILSNETTVLLSLGGTPIAVVGTVDLPGAPVFRVELPIDTLSNHQVVNAAIEVRNLMDDYRLKHKETNNG